jgi:diguanylate cyclase (GGDEF)-like protein/PAS domain S-box-containing protein
LTARPPPTYWLPPLLAGAMNLALAVPLWVKRSSALAVTLGFYLFSAGIWSLAYCLELCGATVEEKLFWSKVEYLGPAGVSLMGLFFVLQYTGKALSFKRACILGIVPALTQVLAWTNEHHGLIWRHFWLDSSGPYLLTGRTHGVWYWVFLVFGYSLNFTSMYLLFRVLFRRRGIYRWQAGAMLVGCTVPFIGNAMHAFGVGPLHQLDLTVFGFSVTGFTMGIGLFRFQLPDIVPIARDVALEGMGDGVVVLDLNRAVVEVNPAAAAIFGHPAAQMVGRPATTAFQEHAEFSRFCKQLADERVEQTILSKGAVRRFDVSCSTLRNRRSRPVGYLLVLRDITEREAASERLRQANDALERRVVERTEDLSRTVVELRGLQEQLSFSALHDSLTQLPNRALFFDRLNERRERSMSRNGPSFALLFVDVDRFKVYNDGYGHDVGDAILMEVGNRLRACFRDSDTVARMGGDEFTVLVEEVSGPEAAQQLGQRCREAVSSPLRLAGRDITATVSIGIALASRSHRNVEEILRDADLAMYHAKRLGGDSVVLFGESLRSSALSALRMEHDLRAAIPAGQLSVQYQPLVRLRTSETVGFEALVRWRHPERGTLLPAEFLPLAEQAGLIVGIDDLVLSQACGQKARWERATAGRRQAPHVSVNIGGWQFFQPEKWWRTLAEALSKNETSHVGLRFEITEEALITNDRASGEFLDQVRANNLAIYLDDFGMGYSSLSRLLRFPIRGVKIDRSFIHGIAASDRELTVTKAIIALARSLDLEVVAEGIESGREAEILQELGCEYGQGFHFSQPVDAEPASEFLARGRG